jgi:hypothetical protein
MLLASVIAWRNEPEPLSLVFVTVKTKGALGLFASDDWRGAVAADCFAFRVFVCISCVGLNEMAKTEARKNEPINITAKVSAIRSAKACGEVFFFIVFFEVRCGDEGKVAGIAFPSAQKQA